MKLKFWSYNDPELHKAWTDHLGDLDFVEIKQGDILSEPSDYIVSPANSFGFMDGGIDLHYRNYFGKKVEDLAKKMIKLRHHGELMVGECRIIPTGDEHIKFLMLVPTMRTPTILTPESPNVYLAMRAICLNIQNPKNEFSISIPGLGTGVGKMPPQICAAHVRLAIDRFLVNDGDWFPNGFKDVKLPGDKRKTMQELYRNW